MTANIKCRVIDDVPYHANLTTSVRVTLCVYTRLRGRSPMPNVLQL
jgi:hypothetical protein